MSVAAIPFQDLVQMISQQEKDLAKLRQDLEARKGQLSDLTRRREELMAQLQTVDAEIQAIGHSSPSPKTVAPASTKQPKTSSPKATSKRSGISLADWLTGLLQETKKPLSVKEMAETLVNRKYPTKSNNVRGLVQTRVNDLFKEGVISRSSENGGYVLAGSRSASKPGRAKSAMAPSTKGGKTSAKNSGAEPKKESLGSIVLKVLTKSQHPLPVQDLMEKVLASGYQTASKDFKNVLYVSLGKIEGIENLAGKGYRLKKARANAAKK